MSQVDRMWPGLIVTHGALGAELLRTAEMILGPQTEVTVGTSVDQSHADLCAFLEEEARSAAARGAHLTVLADLLRGGCGTACAAITGRYPGVLLVSGANLPMLLEFLHHRGRVSARELKTRMVTKGREGILAQGWDGDDAS